MTRICSKCRELKPHTGFARNVSQSGGYAYQCKRCSTTAQRARYAADPRKHIERTQAWAAANVDLAQALSEASNEKRRAKRAAERAAREASTGTTGLEMK